MRLRLSSAPLILAATLVAAGMPDPIRATTFSSNGMYELSGVASSDYGTNSYLDAPAGTVPLPVQDVGIAGSENSSDPLCMATGLCNVAAVALSDVSASLLGERVSANGYARAETELFQSFANASARSHFSIEFGNSAVPLRQLELVGQLDGNATVRLVQLLGGGNEVEIASLSTLGLGVNIPLAVLGVYRLEFEALATSTGNDLVESRYSASARFGFANIPEPALMLLLALAGWGARTRAPTHG